MKSPQKKNDTQWMGAGLAAAVAASLCCITPVVAFLAGIGGVASAFSWIEPFRPYLIGLTILLLGFAWYQKLKSRSETDCECEDKFSFWQSKKFLGLITVLAALLLAFPHYSGSFFSNQKPQVVYVSEHQVETIIFDIEGMTCTGCEATVENAATGVEGVLEAEVSYETEEVIVKFDNSKTDQETIVKAINTTGYIVKNHEAIKGSK